MTRQKERSQASEWESLGREMEKSSCSRELCAHHPDDVALSGMRAEMCVADEGMRMTVMRAPMSDQEKGEVEVEA